MSVSGPPHRHIVSGVRANQNVTYLISVDQVCTGSPDF